MILPICLECYNPRPVSTILCMGQLKKKYWTLRNRMSKFNIIHLQTLVDFFGYIKKLNPSNLLIALLRKWISLLLYKTMPSTKNYVCLKVTVTIGLFFTNRVIIVFNVLLYENSCWGQDEMANDPPVNKLCITSINIVLTSIVKRD